MPVCPECFELNGSRAMFCINCGEMLIPPDKMDSLSQGEMSVAPRAPEKLRRGPPAELTAASTGKNTAPFPEDSDTPASSEAVSQVPFPEDSDTPASSEAVSQVPFPEDSDTPASSEAVSQVPFPEDSDTPASSGAVSQAPFPSIPSEGDAEPLPARADAVDFPEPVEASGGESGLASHSDGGDARRRAAAPFPDLSGDTGFSGDDNAGGEYAPGQDVPGNADRTVFSAEPENASSPFDAAVGAQSPHPDRPGSPLPDLDQIAAEDEAYGDAFPTDSTSAPAMTQAVITAIPDSPIRQGKECGMCGFQNEPEAAYCGQCGTALAASLPVAAALGEVTAVEMGFDGREIARHAVDANGLVIQAVTGDVGQFGEYHVQSWAVFRKSGPDIILVPPSVEGDVFVRIPSNEAVLLPPGRTVRIGGRFLVYEHVPSRSDIWGVLKVEGPAESPLTVPLDNDEILVGRVTGRILFSDDPAISGTHMKLCKTGDECFIYDLQSTNGTFLQINEEYHPKPGQVFLIGTKLFKIAGD